MSAPHHPTPGENLGLTFELIEFAEAMLRQRLRRDHPAASEGDIDAMVGSWYAERPGAELGDAKGVPGTWPRRR
ncbi:MAG: hypothetical protein NEA02_17725 [Thermoanaerobaculia bacterium]|nr:hypothetical protein [Thermoanaerobaculia bacterium]